jgi:hypothetical protein
MSYSRRSALGAASALLVTAAAPHAGIAAPSAQAERRGRIVGRPGQLLLKPLIHHDENAQHPHDAIVWIASENTAWYAIDTMEHMIYRATNHKYKTRGYRLKFVSAFETREDKRFAAAWHLASGPDWHTNHNMSRPKFEKERDDYARRGYRMTYVDARSNYSAIWEQGDASGQQIFSQLTKDEYEGKRDQLAADGYRVVGLSAYAEGSSSHYAAIFDKGAGPATEAHHHMTASQFRNTQTTLAKRGWRLLDASGHMVNGKPLFAGIWAQV